MVKTKTKVFLGLSITGLITSLVITILLAGLLVSENKDVQSTTHQVKGDITPPRQPSGNSTALPVASNPVKKAGNSTTVTNSTSVKNTNTFTLQVGSYLSLNSAKTEAARVAGLGFKAEIYVQEKSPPVYVVRTGNFTDMTAANAEAKLIQQQSSITASIVPMDKATPVSEKAGIPLWLAQVGSFLTQQSAKTEISRLKKMEIKASVVPLYDKKNRLWYAVLLGAFPDEAKAKSTCVAFKEKVNGDCIVYPIDKKIFEARKARGKDSRKK